MEQGSELERLGSVYSEREWPDVKYQGLHPLTIYLGKALILQEIHTRPGFPCGKKLAA
jgi:hypothetical protein